MGILTSMGAHRLDVRYGDRNSLVYYNGIISTTVLADNGATGSYNAVVAGRVMSLTTGQVLVPGLLVTAGTTGSNMPFFAWSGLDANNYPDTLRTRGMPAYSNLPAGGNTFAGIPALTAGTSSGPFATVSWRSAVEFSTTEFDSTLTYTVGAMWPLLANTLVLTVMLLWRSTQRTASAPHYQSPNKERNLK